ncbi:hypothetical protein MRX96_055524 [Rhipicephalus microplus]
MKGGGRKGKFPRVNTSSKFCWVACHGDELPENAVPGGDDVRGDVTYVGRATYAGEVIPGKVVPFHRFCYVAHGGAEHMFRDYQVLVSNGAPLAWLPESNGAVPSGALQGGKSHDGEPLYIGRAKHKGMLTIGKVHPSQKTPLCPFWLQGVFLH